MASKIGFLHIPKCGGTSVARAIYSALGSRNIHIANLRDMDEPWGPHDVLRGHISYRLACAAPFISGHISYADMKELRRDVIFTVLRDPYATLLSNFTYNVGRARDPQKRARLPNLERFRSLTLSDYLTTAKPARLFSALGGDVFSQSEIGTITSQGPVALRENRQLCRQIDWVLKRFDLVMAGDVSTHLARLREHIDLPDIEVSHQNKSLSDLPFALGAPRAEIISRLEWLCWLDEFVYERCVALFPNTMPALGTNAEKTFDAFLERFDPAEG